MYSHLYPLCQLACPPARVQRPLLHAGNPGGPEPAGSGGEEGAEVQLQEEEGEAGETLQHQGGVARQVHPGDRGQAGDSEPGVGRALCVVSTAVTSEGRTLARHDSHRELRSGRHSTLSSESRCSLDKLTDDFLFLPV